MSNRLPDLPLIFEDDSFLIELEQLTEKTVRITRILVFPNNRNGDPKVEQFHDLDLRARRAVIDQINRRYTGRTVKI